MKDDRLLYICSPYHGDTERNTEYAKELMSEAISHDFVPVASHLSYPLVLNDNNLEERKQGKSLGIRLLYHCQYILVGDRYGISKGMQNEIDFAKSLGIEVIKF